MLGQSLGNLKFLLILALVGSKCQPCQNVFDPTATVSSKCQGMST